MRPVNADDASRLLRSVAVDLAARVDHRLPGTREAVHRRVVVCGDGDSAIVMHDHQRRGAGALVGEDRRHVHAQVGEDLRDRHGMADVRRAAVALLPAVGLLGDAAADEHHEFWADDISLLDPAGIDRTRVHGARQVTDVYLLALAVRHGGRFVTFDRAVPLSAVPGATPANLVVL